MPNILCGPAQSTLEVALVLDPKQVARVALENGHAQVSRLKAAVQEESVKGLDAKKAKLAGIAGGLPDGQSWKADLSNTASWPVICKTARAMLKKELATSLTKSFVELTEENSSRKMPCRTGWGKKTLSFGTDLVYECGVSSCLVGCAFGLCS